jgi:hypothetical protein
MAFDGIITLFVGLTVAVVLVGSVVIPTIYSTNQSGWAPSVVTFFTILLPIVVVAALLLIVLR